MNYAEIYEKTGGKIRNRPEAVTAVKAADRFLTAVFYLIYPITVGYGFWMHLSYRYFLILVPGISFVVVSAFRHLVNRRRPYEASGITPLWHKDTRGHSFPSRHVFSSAVIAMTLCRIHLPSGMILLVLSGVEGVIRVIAGVHYPSDVTAGWIIGVLCGFMYWL